MTWRQVEGACRCTRCGNAVQASWRYFPRPSIWTLAYCERCVNELLREDHR